MGNPGVALYRAGYRELVFVRKGEKAPAQVGWPDAYPTAGEVKGWGGSFGLNARHFPGIDIDIEPGYEELADQLQVVFLKQLGPAPLRLSHDPSSRLLVYRTGAPFRKKVLHLGERGKVEILGEGRQYVVAGEHPDGPPHYRWESRDLSEWNPSDLTEITEEQVDNLLDILAGKLGGFVGRKSSGADAVVPLGELRAPDVERVAQLVQRLPNTDTFLSEVFPEQPTPRDYWVAMGMAIKGAAGEAGEQVFVDWTRRYEDGPVDLDDARGVYQGLVPEWYGWPTLSRIDRDHRNTPAVEAFEIEPPPEGYEVPTSPGALLREHAEGSDEFYAERVLAEAKDKLRFVKGAWMRWTGSVWKDDTSKAGHSANAIVRKVLRRLALQLVAQAVITNDEKIKTALQSKARGLQSRARITAVQSLIETPLVEDIEMFDRNQLELNTPDGIIDLVSGDLRATTPDDLVTRQTNGRPGGGYRPDQAPTWEAFLDHITEGDNDLRHFLQRWSGYSLTGRMNEKKFVFIWGSHPHTGKSTFINAIAHAMGDYAVSEDISLFMGGMSDSRRSQGYARLAGARLVTATEPSVGQKWDDSSIKQVTGADPVVARQLYREPFEFHPTFKIMVGGNNEPELKVVDEAMLNRILVVPMNNVVPPEKMDPEMDLKLAAEADSILTWMIEGALAWREEGLAPPTVVQETTQAYAEEEDRIGQWLEDCCEVADTITKSAEARDGEGSFTTSRDLYRSWKAWAGARGIDPMGSTALGRELASRLNLVKGRTEAGRGYYGITLLKREALLGEPV